MEWIHSAWFSLFIFCLLRICESLVQWIFVDVFSWICFAYKFSYFVSCFIEHSFTGEQSYFPFLIKQMRQSESNWWSLESNVFFWSSQDCSIVEFHHAFGSFTTKGYLRHENRGLPVLLLRPCILHVQYLLQFRYFLLRMQYYVSNSTCIVRHSIEFNWFTFQFFDDSTITINGTTSHPLTFYHQQYY